MTIRAKRGRDYAVMVGCNPVVFTGSEPIEQFENQSDAQAYLDSGKWSDVVKNASESDVWVGRWADNIGWVSVDRFDELS